ncbi:hypothetical protein [Streptomyces sp. NPDC000880]
MAVRLSQERLRLAGDGDAPQVEKDEVASPAHRPGPDFAGPGR